MADNLFDLTDRVAVVSGAAQRNGPRDVDRLRRVRRRSAARRHRRGGHGGHGRDDRSVGPEGCSGGVRHLRPGPDRRALRDPGPGVRPHRHPGQRGRGGAPRRPRRAHPRADPARHAEPRDRALPQHPAGRPAHDRGRQGQHHEHRLHRRLHGARPAPHPLQHGDGRGGADDPRAELGVGRPWACA